MKDKYEKVMIKHISQQLVEQEKLIGKTSVKDVLFQLKKTIIGSSLSLIENLIMKIESFYDNKEHQNINADNLITSIITFSDYFGTDATAVLQDAISNIQDDKPNIISFMIKPSTSDKLNVNDINNIFESGLMVNENSLNKSLNTYYISGNQFENDDYGKLDFDLVYRGIANYINTRKKYNKNCPTYHLYIGKLKYIIPKKDFLSMNWLEKLDSYPKLEISNALSKYNKLQIE